MIIYGTNSKQLAQEILATTCPGCGSQNSVNMYVFQKYAHVFWIPFFPMKKMGVSQCTRCGQVLKLEDMPSPLTTAFNVLKATTKTPLWMFSGMALLAAIIIIVVISEKNNDKKKAQYILAPQRGDIFEIKTNWNTYTIFRVEQIMNDSVFVRFNSYETNSSTGIRKIKRDHGYDYAPGISGFSKVKLKEMFNEGKILDIDR